MTTTTEIAKFSTSLSFSDLPDEVVDKAKMCLLDTIGVMAVASTTPAGKKIAQFIRARKGTPEATVICSGFKAPCLDAAFVNGSLVEIPENQDGLRYGGIHQSSAVIPAALASAEHAEISGKDLVTAIVLGYEVCGRVAAATHPRQTLKGFIPVGTVGPFGAAVAVGKVLDFNPELMVDALGIAGFLAPISRLESFYKTCKPIHGGQAASMGVLSALLAAEGLKGSDEILEGYCKGIVEEPNIERITHRLGETHEIMETYLKPYTSCRHTHGAIEATLKLVRKHNITPSDVTEVRVRTYNAAFKIVGRRYPSRDSSFVDVQFSIPYTVAAAITDKALGITQISSSRIGAPEILALAKKVQTFEDPALTEIYPDKTATTVEIDTKQGKMYTERVDLPKGDPRNPFDWTEIQDKFNEMASHALDSQRISKLYRTIKNLERSENVSDLMVPLQNPRT